jgi:hypothetical protein
LKLHLFERGALPLINLVVITLCDAVTTLSRLHAAPSPFPWWAAGPDPSPPAKKARPDARIITPLSNGVIFARALKAQ